MSCSGDMYSSVPSVCPAAVSAGPVEPPSPSPDTILAMPKSSTLTKSGVGRDSR